jgi:voltage-gated potassium channel
MKLRSRLFEILETAKPGDRLSKTFDISIIILIVLNIIAVVVGTIENIALTYSPVLVWFEVFSIVIFSIEYLLRLWVCTKSKKFRKPIIGRISFILTPLAIIDLVVILPFYLPMFITLDLRFLRIMRMIRLFRLFKLGRYSTASRLLIAVVNEKKEELLIAVFTVLLLVLGASSLMYVVEHEAQPEAFSSIPAAMWWGIITLTTVGYGDMYPVTILGKLLGAVIALLGVGLVALPAGILASGFESILQKERKKEN